MTRDRPVSIRSQAGTWPDNVTSTLCKRGCCWTPGYGHSTAATNCICHNPVTAARTPQERLMALGDTLDLLTPARGAQHPKGTR